jgi:hypothetical protein
MEVSIMLLCTQPALIDVVRGIPFQDAAKAGLLFGDEGEPRSAPSIARNSLTWFWQI